MHATVVYLHTFQNLTSCIEFVFNAFNREQHFVLLFSPSEVSTSELLLLRSSSDDGNCECGRSPEKEADGENIDLVNDSCMPRRFTSKTASISFDKKCMNKESFQIYAHRMLQVQSVVQKTKPIVDTMLTCVEHSRSGAAAGTENKPRLFTIWDVGAGSGAVYLGLLLKEDELIKRNVCVHLVAIDADEHMVDFLSGMAEKESISLNKDENHKAWDISSDASPRISANSALVTMTVLFGNARRWMTCRRAISWCSILSYTKSSATARWTRRRRDIIVTTFACF